LSDQLEQLLDLLRDVLGANLAGAYQHGSAVLGGEMPTSDIDVLAVSHRSPSSDECSRLAAALLEMSGRPRSIELTIVAEPALRPWRFPPRMEFLYGDWLRDEFAGGRVPPPAANADLALVIELARRGNRALIGPPPAELFEPVPQADLATAMLDGIDGLLAELPTDTRNVLLTLARMWVTLATGDIRRKDHAAAWVVDRLPSDLGGVVARARQMYLEGTYGPWAELEPLIQPAAHYMAAEIRRLASDH
jgi:predicted nucleotidyltransferase